MLARIYKQANRYGDMRRAAQQALASAPEGQRDGVRTLIARVLGPTALEADPLADEGGDEAAAGDADEAALGDDGAGDEPGSLQLGGGSRLLGGGGDEGGGPGLLDGEGEGSEPLLRGGDPSTLRLGEPGAGSGGGFRLNLDD
jgi:hypothetical protein